MLYHVGDFIFCRVSSDGKIVFDIDFDDTRYKQFSVKSLEVVGIFNQYYIIVAPNCIHAAHIVDEEFLQEHNIDVKFLYETVTFVREIAVGGRQHFDPYLSPLSCKICKEYFPYALSNQTDGTLICWVCRNTRVR